MSRETTTVLEAGALTLNEVLKRLGMSKVRSDGMAGAMGHYVITREDGSRVCEGNANDVWIALRAQGLVL